MAMLVRIRLSLLGFGLAPCLKGVPRVAVLPYPLLYRDPRGVPVTPRSSRRRHLVRPRWVILPTPSRRGTFGLLDHRLLQQRLKLLVDSPSLRSIGLRAASEE